MIALRIQDVVEAIAEADSEIGEEIAVKLYAKHLLMAAAEECLEPPESETGHGRRAAERVRKLIERIP